MEMHDEIQINLDDAFSILRDSSESHGTASLAGMVKSGMV